VLEHDEASDQPDHRRIEMAESIFAPGVERQTSDWRQCETRYYGTAQALASAGLIASDCQMPGTQPGKRGVRWKDVEGRRHVLAKGGQGTLCLTVYPTARERMDKQLAARNAQRDKAIKAELGELCVEEDVWRERMARTASCGVVSMVRAAFRDEAPGEPNPHWAGPYSYSQQTRQEMGEHWEAIRALLYRAPLQRDANRIEALKRERARLQDAGLQSFLAKLGS
jgi:hypothetical protein